MIKAWVEEKTWDLAWTGHEELGQRGQGVTRRRTPFATLDEAFAEAKRIERRLFVVVFDENHPLLSKLDHPLGYFMENETTEALIDTHFVVAVIPFFSAGISYQVARWSLCAG